MDAATFTSLTFADVSVTERLFSHEDTHLCEDQVHAYMIELKRVCGDTSTLCSLVHTVCQRHMVKFIINKSDTCLRFACLLAIATHDTVGSDLVESMFNRCEINLVDCVGQCLDDSYMSEVAVCTILVSLTASLGALSPVIAERLSCFNTETRSCIIRDVMKRMMLDEQTIQDLKSLTL